MVELLARRDFLTLGNTAIETLMRPGQDKNPDGRSKVIDEFMPQVVREFCGIHDGLTYARPFSDMHVEFADRDTWEKDRFPELVIHAYMIGATLRKLPPAYAPRVRFFGQMAAAQVAAIHETHFAYLNANEVPMIDRNTSSPERRAWEAKWNAASQSRVEGRQTILNSLQVWENEQAWVRMHAAHDKTLRDREEDRRKAMERQAQAEREEKERAEAAKAQAEAEAGIGDSELARQIREILASGMDASLINAEIAFLVKHSKPPAAT